MTTKTATEEQLGSLHSKLAQVMTNALDVVEKAQQVYLELPMEEAIGPAPEVSAPLMGVVAKFLSDNKITCQPSDSKELSALEERLKNKVRRNVGNVVHLETE